MSNLVCIDTNYNSAPTVVFNNSLGISNASHCYHDGKYVWITSGSGSTLTLNQYSISPSQSLIQEKTYSLNSLFGPQAGSNENLASFGGITGDGRDLYIALSFTFDFGDPPTLGTIRRLAKVDKNGNLLNVMGNAFGGAQKLPTDIAYNGRYIFTCTDYALGAYRFAMYDPFNERNVFTKDTSPTPTTDYLHGLDYNGRDLVCFRGFRRALQIVDTQENLVRNYGNTNVTMNGLSLFRSGTRLFGEHGTLVLGVQ